MAFVAVGTIGGLAVGAGTAIAGAAGAVGSAAGIGGASGLLGSGMFAAGGSGMLGMGAGGLMGSTGMLSGMGGMLGGGAAAPSAMMGASPMGMMMSGNMAGGALGSALTTSGLAGGTAGGMGLFNAMNLAGMGLQAAQAFSGGNNQGANILEKLPQTKEEKENAAKLQSLSKKEYEAAQAGQLDQNLTSRFIKQLTSGKQAISQTTGAVANISGATAKADSGTNKGVGDAGGAKAIIAGAKGASGVQASYERNRFGQHTERMQGAIANYKNIMAAQRQTGAQEYGSSLYKSGLTMQSQAEQGAALGQIASMGGLMGYMNQRGMA